MHILLVIACVSLGISTIKSVPGFVFVIKSVKSLQSESLFPPTFEPCILNVIEVATTGKAYNNDAEPFAVQELLSVKEALKALTIDGAWLLGLENERGSIKVGKYADFVVLDKNFLHFEGEDLSTIHNAKILNTYFEGEKVYTSK